MNSFKLQCIALRKDDYTLPEIVRMTGRSKTSVYFHIKNIPLSASKQRQIKKNTRERAAHVARSRKGKSVRSFNTFLNWDTDTVCLVAHLIFDGEIKRCGCAYNNRSNSLISKVERKMKHIYDFSPKRYKNPDTGVIRISYYNVALADYLKEKSNQLLDVILDLQKEHKREFLKAFFNDEGCIDFKPKKNSRRVRGCQKDIAILEIVKRLLQDFNIDAQIQLPNEVVISKKENLLRFQEEIGFSSGVKMNGNRSNSVWKKHVEKRDILKKAIDSYIL
ncbi:LAGLIDADG family homing endonuclease [candidate division KSB1 bacterium]